MAFDFNHNIQNSVEPEYNPGVGMIQYTVKFIHPQRDRFPNDPWPETVYNELLELKEKTEYKRIAGIYAIDVSDNGDEQLLVITTPSLKTLGKVIHYLYGQAKNVKVHCLIHSIETTIDFNAAAVHEPYKIEILDLSSDIIMPASKQHINISKLACDQITFPAYYASSILFTDCNTCTQNLMVIYTKTKALQHVHKLDIKFAGNIFKYVHGAKAHD